MSAHLRIVFVGVHQEAEAPFRYLLGAPDRVAGLVTLKPEARPKVSGAVDLAMWAVPAGVPVLEVSNVNEPECVEWIREKAPDLVLVVGWTQLLREPLLRVPRVHCLGFHASLLPRYRGRAPVNWALIHGEKETGNTMIVLEPEADAGDIVAQRRIPITDEDDCGTLYRKVSATEVEMLQEVLPQIRQGKLPRRPQDDGQSTVMPKRRPEDGLIDWTWPTVRIRNWVRALTHPYPGAFSHSGSRKLYVWKVAIPTLHGEDRHAGRISVDAQGWPLVATGDGWVRLVSVQEEGGSLQSGLEAMGTLLAESTVLGLPPAQVR